MDGFYVPKGYGALLLDVGGGDVDVQGEGQMVRDGIGEVEAGEVANGYSGGADQVQGVTFFMGRKIDMLNDVK